MKAGSRQPRRAHGPQPGHRRSHQDQSQARREIPRRQSCQGRNLG